jgi:hypothetical protein
MAKAEIDVVVEPGRVRVYFDSTSRSPHGRFYFGFVVLALFGAILLILPFAPGDHGGPSLWQRVRETPAESYRFLIPTVLLLTLFAVLAWLVIRALRLNYPGGQRLECDGLTLTVSWLRWLDWDNRDWITQTYALNDVSRLRYAAIFQSRRKLTWGLRFTVAGKSYKLFPHLTNQQAGMILEGFEALGANTDRIMRAARKVARENR